MMNKQPRAIKGFIKTLNNYGYMLSNPHPYSQLFIDSTSHLKAIVLDIGAAYGVTAIPALKNGAQVIANDIDPRHLNILFKKVPPDLIGRLSLLPGKFPDDVELRDNSLDAVHAAGVLHFLPPDLLEIALGKILKFLKPGGKFYFITTTPFINLFKEFLCVYEERKQQGHPWPGLIEDSSQYLNGYNNSIPKLLTLLDLQTTQAILMKVGFEIEKISYVPYQKAPKRMLGEGRETIGVVAVKKR